ncbi:selenide, water dikinase SelD [Palleronia caenipelagi]|uniref:Selenide, water dikinase SelD n=1 Tax=Palleronia caenipelagi TaxID=2489174 RepID=A0A547QAC1_9RHOB|nr:selenide, water dikinase SelD [Palleronia caenipelagi]TRD23331.1 selenide, water dikinase SelD [Palleronia caenipelagi]
MDTSLPATRDIVLIGGGHAHALVLRRWGMKPLPGARLTVINPAPTAPYTGMLPGFVAGHYGRDDLEIDLVRLARFAGARILLGQATGLDRDAQEVIVEDRLLGTRRIGYDAASVDIGIHSGMPALPGFAEHAIPAKPLDRYAAAWEARVASGDDSGIVVIGGGVAGCELAMAMRHRLPRPEVTVIDRGEMLDGLGDRARTALLARLAALRVTLIEGATVAEVTADNVKLTDGREVPAGFVIGAAGAKPYPWLAETGLTLTDGFIDVGATLQSSDPKILAAGDCAHMTHAPRPKAGVFAVRQAPVIYTNLRALVSGGPLKNYTPQKHFLKLIYTGDKTALAERGGLAVRHPKLWHWKDRIDRKFMDKVSDLPKMPRPKLPAEVAKGLERELRQAPCGGCGAKVSRQTLRQALESNQPPLPEFVETGPGDDAAIIRTGGARQVLTVDQLRAFTADPALLAHVSALHALGDCIAMGAVPQTVMSVLTLPRLSPALEARTMGEIITAVNRAIGPSGAAIIGGHSATGAEMQVGFSMTGLLGDGDTALGQARPGDALVLTKPLGTGVVLAGEMALDATGSEAVAAWASMVCPIRPLPGASSATDVTGFGLAGHLLSLCEAAGLGAEIDLDRLPLLPGAERLLRAGTRSTLHASNREVALFMDLPDTDLAEILFDPQTAGGLLASIPQEHLVAVLETEPHARVIGRLVEGPLRIIVTADETTKPKGPLQ